MEYLSIEEISDRLSQVEGVLREHTEDKEAHEEANFSHSGFLQPVLARQLYTDGLRYKGLPKSEINKYSLEKMSFGNYIGFVQNFSDYPQGESDQLTDTVVVTISGYGSIIDLPSQENDYGTGVITDSGLYRHIKLINISQGRKFEKYMGGIYDSKKNYGWINSGHWEKGKIIAGSGLLEARRWFDGTAIDIELTAEINSMSLKSSNRFAKIAELPSGYTADASKTTYYTAFAQNTTTNSVFTVPLFINNNGKDINVAITQDLDIIKFRINTSSFTDGPINL